MFLLLSYRSRDIFFLMTSLCWNERSYQNNPKYVKWCPNLYIYTSYYKLICCGIILGHPFLSISHCLMILQHLRQAGIAGRFVEFFGPGVSQLSAPDRTTIANMCPEYNATVSFFPVDQVALKHFKKTRESHSWFISLIQSIHLFTRAVFFTVI